MDYELILKVKNAPLLNVTRERIRQIESKGLSRLKKCKDLVNQSAGIYAIK